MRFSYKQLLRLFFPETLDERTLREASPTVFLPAPRRAAAHTTALLSYEVAAVRAAVHLAKFHHHEEALRALAGTLRTYRLREPGGVLVPIPLSRKRYRERGYNQVDEILRLTGLPRASLLTRQRHTTPQADLDRAARQTNLTGAFALDQKTAARLPKDTPITLIDDVTTTGATLLEARAVLVNAGYTNVQCLALAH